MLPHENQSLSHDPIHGYIAFTSPASDDRQEVTERHLIDHPWVQRLRQIHQLQTAWWVFPSAEHTRFQHVLGAMHLASRATDALYESLVHTCVQQGETVPSRGYVESLLRVAALLHDVGHGPFGHFFDQYYLADYGLTHETLGAEIIRRDLADLIRGLRRTPRSKLADHERLDPEHVALLIVRPKDGQREQLPLWLRLLRSLFCGLYTLDNMDFVLRDAYMSGYNIRAFDLDRLLHYSFFTPQGLTIHERGLSALVRFISVRAELFHAVYFHRTVRAIDLALRDVFLESKNDLLPGNPLDNLRQYQQLTEWSLLAEVSRWPHSSDPRLRKLGARWQQLLHRRIPWKLVCERTVVFRAGRPESSSIFSDERLFEHALRRHLPPELRDLPLRCDPARHVYRPGAHTPAAGQNYLFDAATEEVRPLEQRDLFRQIPQSYRVCRIYAETTDHRAELAQAMDRLLEDRQADDATNM